FHEVELDHVLVVHDEIDLDFGTVRVKQGGGHGGHNGLRSIIEQMKPDFLRVRVGVGKPPGSTQEKDVSRWVLGDFPSGRAAEAADLIHRGATAVEAVLGLGLAAAMNELNRRTSLTA